MKKIKVAIAGSSGRMGRALLEGVLQSSDLVLHAALEDSASPHIGKDAGGLVGDACGVTIMADVAGALCDADVLIDFTRPEGTMRHLGVCKKLGVSMVVGTTGFSASQKTELNEAAQFVGIVLSSNMSVGVNVAFKILEMTSKILSHGYDIEIVEAHHRHKVDAPSGTALAMGEVIAKTLGRTLSECAIYGREGVTGERDASSIGFATVRGGDIMGDHTVLFAGIGERIEITHKASSRATFALGALRATRFLQANAVGMYDMQDVLGLR
ncbi:MAG: 4-hydroxy-tetrahydrodipicolinate reductase [Candidatus Nitrotoga sp.]|nr:4-hydroxy-tetrahydrodipicolinate reductase [Candidatus Nitrotoga sp.]MBP0117284.1 4-hydroxy-tetrahydrodipicolinate reductase [Candidatus Nitrotoga sp.]MBP0123012.1 4-hydroxy-tetrahydrodipicolinate reductase [Candidatus Nitrotoga sp.]MBP0125575.1 4-hydroxy-tetrahydrodipicolinate reductase [Candidatus Nitrotoga sp.]